MTAQKWSLFLDFDGTLVDIAPQPDAVVVDAGIVPMLRVLQEELDGCLAMVSGRSLATLDRFLAPLAFDAAGMHGLEQRLATRTFRCDPTKRPELGVALEKVTRTLGEIGGVFIEDKGCAFSVHWREAPLAEKGVLLTLTDVLKVLGGDYRLQLGKCVGEIIPMEASKGHAIAAFLKHSKYSDRRPIFIGDDLTDEDGFRVVNDVEGVSIHVGKLQTVAQHRIPSPTAVRHLLQSWIRLGDIGNLAGTEVADTAGIAAIHHNR
ncbi:trehalose-phosphatase [Roseiarcaceae bacterium H3SJ34-1]|uniref:trehalose-phosphatase n=1 Tax=Terripilifer ovatus TaxID=3032367 RepID=UPI003AB9BBF3|nr:trehalose-phosphatase [Roseiarcaceae bacterium H3SJ34-1]